MAKTSYVNLLPELEEAYYKNLQSGDRFVFPRIRKKIPFLSRSRKKGVALRSLIPEIAEIWNNFSDAERAAWSAAGAEANLNGWRLFIQDQALRIKNDLPGVAIPVLLHQSFVGVLQIDEPADELKIIQIHPHFYWVSQKVYGKKGMYVPILVTEDLTLPFKISLNYRAELEEVTPPSFAKFYARVWHSYQGQDFYSVMEIPLDYINDWKKAEATISLFGVGPFGDTTFGSESEVLGYYIGYEFYIHLKGLRGTLYIDNVKVEHSNQNWARDSYCKDINQGFTRAFYQIPKHWSGVIAPDGAWFESFYIDW